ncbi:hypothetical protein [Streptomyces sp. NBC_01615]
MGMSQFYGPAAPAESIATIQTAIDVGVDFSVQAVSALAPSSADR